MFLKNAWYVASWSSEINHELQQIKVLGEKICIYRTSDNEVVALEDACPHRKLPLSKGRIKNNTVECGYHGLTFNGQGKCIWAPGDGSIPTKAKVHAYPVHEKYDLIWIWMGDPERADSSNIIDIPNFDNPAWGVNQGAAMDLHCNYLLMCDNLLDPSHEHNGLAPDFICRSGICSTCKHTLVEGEVEYFIDPLEPPAEGEVLLCCSRPVGRVVIEL